MQPLVTQLLGAGSLILACLLVLAFAKIVNDLITPYVVDVELARSDNTALAVSFGGYFMAVLIVFCRRPHRAESRHRVRSPECGRLFSGRNCFAQSVPAHKRQMYPL